MTLRTEQLEHQYSYKDIFILLKRMGMIDEVKGVNITNKGYKFELTVTGHNAFYCLFQNGIPDKANETTIKLKPLIPPIIINVTNVPLNAYSGMVEIMIQNEAPGFEHVHARAHLVTFEGKRFSTGRWEIHAWCYNKKELPPLPTHSTYFCDRYVSLHYQTNDRHPTPTNHTFIRSDDSSDDEEDDLPLPTRDEARKDTLPTPQPQSTTIDRQPSPETRIKPPKSPAKPTSINRQPPPETAITPVAMASPPTPEPHIDEVVNKTHFHYEHIISNKSTPIKIIRRWRDRDKTLK